ncbi:MAG: hypothetical protein BRC28_01505 [Nanohaloarchaea archaeon SW_4_43_9]|nr:MAG: hypothetical protein BRC28_01505 [Nanohaloarchaea archaeon SW_4_43_9]
MTTIKDKIREKALSPDEHTTAVKILEGEAESPRDLTREESIEADRSNVIQYDDKRDELYLDSEVYSYK